MSIWTSEEFDTIRLNPSREAMRNALLRLQGKEYPHNSTGCFDLECTKRIDAKVTATTTGFTAMQGNRIIVIDNLSVDEVLIWLRWEWQWSASPPKDSGDPAFFALIVLPCLLSIFFVFFNLVVSMQQVNILNQKVDLIKDQMELQRQINTPRSKETGSEVKGGSGQSPASFRSSFTSASMRSKP